MAEDAEEATPQLLMREAAFGTFDVETSLATRARATANRAYPRHSLRGQIRATFLAAVVWKRWLHVVSSTRAAAVLDVALQPAVKRSLSLAFDACHHHASQKVSSRAAARLLFMVLRPLVMRMCIGAFSQWRAQASSAATREQLDNAFKKAVKKLEISHRKALEVEKATSTQAAAEAKLHCGLREQELQRRLNIETLQRAEQFVVAFACAFSKQRIARIASAFAAILISGSCAKFAGVHTSLAEEACEREALAAEIGNLTAADAAVSAELSRAAQKAMLRAQYSSLTAGTLQLKRNTSRRLRIGFSKLCALRHENVEPRTPHINSFKPHVITIVMVIAIATRRPLREAWCGLMRNIFTDSSTVKTSLKANRFEFSPEPQHVQLMHLDYAQDAVTSKTQPSVERHIEEIYGNSIGSARRQCPVGDQALQSAMSVSLAERSDAVLRLKVRLGLRSDFAARVWPVPLPKPSCLLPRDGLSSGVDVDVLNDRLSRGAASLMEYILASAMRARQRIGLNAFLAACRMHRRREVSASRRRQHSRPRHLGTGGIGTAYNAEQLLMR